MIGRCLKLEQYEVVTNDHIIGEAFHDFAQTEEALVLIRILRARKNLSSGMS